MIKTKPLTMNVLPMKHRIERLTVYLSNTASRQAIKFSETDAKQLKSDYQLPDSWNEVYAYMSENPTATFELSKPVSPTDCKQGESCWSLSFLKKYYTWQLGNYFRTQQLPCLTNFVCDTEVWIKTASPYAGCTGYKAYTVRVQFNYVEQEFEMVVIVGELHSVYNKALTDSVFSETNHDIMGWVLHGTDILRRSNLTDSARRDLSAVFPCINPVLRSFLKLPVPAPDRGNRYTKHFEDIEAFKKQYLETKEVAQLMLLNNQWRRVEPQFFDTTALKMLSFGTGKHTQPKYGMPSFGPKELVEDDVVFLFIGHQLDKPLAFTLNEYFKGNHPFEFKGISKYLNLIYKTEPSLSIWFNNKQNPLPEIESELKLRKEQQFLKSSKRYVAIYLSPHSKTSTSEASRKIYYRVKELMLAHGIVTQTIDVQKAWGSQRQCVQVGTEGANDRQGIIRKAKVTGNFHYGLANISVAILAKLGACPWHFEEQKEKELVIGISAYTSRELGKKYIGSAFSFTGEGQFGGFACFSEREISELAGSIKLAVKDFCKNNTGIHRLIIHFYKKLSYKDLKQIQNALADLNLSIPVVVVSINKNFSDDMVGFDLSAPHLMPISGHYLAINNKQYLLYNNQLTSANDTKIDQREGFPFPLKISVQQYLPHSKTALNMTEEELIPILEQVCRFSLLYWKSVSRQWLPVTLRYPEMLAQIAPHFKYKDWGELGGDSLWFL